MFPARNVAINKSDLVGTWECLTRTRAMGVAFTDDKAFGADDWHTSTKFPEGKKYAYRLDRGNLVVTFRVGEQIEKVIRLTPEVLELYRGSPGQITSVTCRKKS